MRLHTLECAPVAALRSVYYHSMPKHDQPNPQPEMPAAPEDSAPAASARPPESPKWSRWVAPSALVCALIAVALAAWALLRPAETTNASPSETVQEAAPEAAPVTDQQIADAEARACGAFNIVRGAVSLQTNDDPGSDPAAVRAAAANARLSLTAGGAYLRTHLDPATPPPLADAIRSFADQIENVGMNQLAGVPNDDPAQAARMSDTGAAMTHLAEICP